MATPQAIKLRSGKELLPMEENQPTSDGQSAGRSDSLKSPSDQGKAQANNFSLAPSAHLDTPSMPKDTNQRSQDQLDLGPALEGMNIKRFEQEDVGESRQIDRVRRLDKEREKRPYKHMGDDPDPTLPGINKKDFNEHIKVLRDYSTAMFSAYRKTENMKDNLMWQDFVTAFRPHTLRAWTRPMVVEWKALLTQRGIHLDQNRDRQQIETIIDVLYRSEHIQADAEETENQKGNKPGKEDGVAEDGVDKKGEKERTNRGNHGGKRDYNDKATQISEKDENMSAIQTKASDPEDPDNDDSSSDDENKPPTRKGNGEMQRKEEKGIRRDNFHEKKPWMSNEAKDESSNSYEQGKAITSMIKSFHDMPKYSGSFQEDLDETVEAFETIAELCNVTEDATKKKAIPIMLKGSAFRQYSRNKDQVTTYQEGLQLLRGWYDSREKQTRLLKEWNGMRFSEYLQQDSTKSELEVFRIFVDKSMSLQQQLHSAYHGDRQLRDQLMIAVDLSRIQDALTDRQPRTSHQLTERVANKLSHKVGTAGSTVALLTSPTTNADNANSSQAFYGLGQKYGGDAKKTVTQFGRKPWTDRRTHRKPNDFRKRRPPPWWMKGVRGCFVCRKPDHRANEKHSKEEVSAAIKKLKMKHPTALLTTEDNAYIADLFDEDTDEPGDDDDGEAHWAEADDDDSQDDSEVAYIATSDLVEIEGRLSDAAFIHATEVSPTLNRNRTSPPIGNHDDCKGQAEFKGVRIDTCANRTSVMGEIQYRAYCKKFNVINGMRPIDNRTVNGIGGSEKGIGIVAIDIPFSGLKLIINVKFLILSPNIPALLSMKDMVDNGLDLSIQNSTISFGERTHDLTMSNYFLIHLWEPTEFNFILYTETELRTIHRSFGHPSVGATSKLIARAQEGALDRETREAIKKIAEDCAICKREKGPPRRFKLTVGTKDLRFNYAVQVDTMFLRGRPVCHMIDEATHYTAARFLRSQSANEIWRAIQQMWMLVYLGPPDFISVDQGSAYISKEMRANCETAGVTIREAPIETPGTIGTVERYHAPLRTAYERIRSDLDKQTSDAECLTMAVYAVNCTVGPEGLCPTLLVFGAIPRPIRKRPSPMQIERSAVIEKAMMEAAKEQACRRLAFGLRHTHGPKGVEASSELRKLPAGSPVLVYRTKTKKWEGPWLFVSVDGETAIIQNKSGRKIHRSVCVRPWIRSNLDATEVEEREDEQDEDGRDSNPPDHAGDIFTTATAPTKKDTVEQAGIQPKNAPGFRSARRQELQGLIENGTFRPTKSSTVPEGTRIFGSRFIDELKKANTGLRKKSRLVAQNYQDHGAAETPTKAPTIQRFSQRTFLSLAASLNNMTIFSRDITQAYVQSKSALERPIFIRPPTEMQLPNDVVLQVVKPLYGIPESGLHWYLTYLHHHQERLGMHRSTTDPCFLMRHDNTGQLDGIVILQVDDSLAIGTKQFLEDEEQAATRFKSKPRHMLADKPTTFNGIRITKDVDGIFVEQGDKIDKLQKAETPKQFASQRAAAQYIGVNSRPDVCANVQLIAPGKDQTKDPEYKSFNKVIDFLNDTKHDGLRFVKLNMATMRLMVVSDASFANADGSRSQLGFLVIMADDEGRANIVHYGSSKCKRVTRSVMASELHARILAFDYAFLIRDLLMQIMKKPTQIHAFVDSKCVFDIIAKDGRTTERRLQIDVHALKESYERGELAQIGWIKGESNPADALTKENVNKKSPLRALMETNRISLTPTGWASVVAIEKKNARMSTKYVERVCLCLDHDNSKHGNREDGDGTDDGVDDEVTNA